MSVTGSGGFLVVGGNGALGSQLLEDLPDAVGACRAGGGPFETLDITDRAGTAALIDRLAPAWVVNTAAMTSVDGCEQDPDAAHTVHVDGTANLVRACERAGSGLIHLSTNYVFDGVAGPYGEADDANPVNVYGQTKLESEAVVNAGSCAAIVIRTAVFYGTGIDRPNFVTWALRELLNGRPVRIVTDEWANPTFIPDLSGAIRDLAQADARGLFHVAGADYLTRHEMVAAVCEVFGLDPGLVTPVLSSDLGQAAERPKRAGLRTDKAEAALGRGLVPFRTGLAVVRDRIGDAAAWARDHDAIA